MNPLKFLPNKWLPGIVRAATRAYIPPGAPRSAIYPPVSNAPSGGNGGPSEIFPLFIVPSVQARWLGAGVAWYTPQKVEYIYRQALAGDLQSQWEMFDLMEATWPELSKCLNELKDGVVELLDCKRPGLPSIAFCPGDDSDEADRRKCLVEAALRGMKPRAWADENDYSDTVRDALDARGKGIAVLEIDWETRGVLDAPALIAPRATRWVHPSWYGYPFGPGNEQLFLKLGGIRLDNQFSPSGKPVPLAPLYTGIPGESPNIRYRYPMGGDLPPIQSPLNFYSAVDFTPFPDFKFIVSVAKNKSGHPLGGAMLHVLAWYWSAMNFSLEWFLNFTQVFGQPIRWATYDPQMDDADQKKLEAMLKNMGTAAWAMFPDGAQMELKESAQRGENPQERLVSLCNTAARLLILRQTLTADVGGEGSGSRALGEVHERVEDDVKLGCGRWIAKQIQQLADATHDLNFGPDGPRPRVELVIPDEDQSVQTSEVLSNISTAGLEPTDEALPDLSAKLGFDVQRKAPPEPDPALVPGSPPNPTNGIIKGAAAGIPSPGHPSDAVAARRSPALEMALRGAHAPAYKIIMDSASAEDAFREMCLYYRDWKPERARQIIEEAEQIAAAEGTKIF